MRSLCQAGSDDRRRAARTLAQSHRAIEMSGQKQAEEVQARLASAVELSTESVVLTDSRGYIRYVNPAFERCTGYTREEVIGKSPHILDSGRHDEAFYRSMRDALSRDRLWHGELISRKKDGTLYHEECTIAPVNGRPDDCISFISIRRDIMDKIRLQSIAEMVDVEKNNNFIYTGVRHEIGNVVNSLVMLLGVALSKFDSMDKGVVRGYLSRALEQATKGSYLLRSLKNANLFDKPVPQNIRLSAFMDKFIGLVKEDFAAKGVVISANMNDPAIYCYADTRLLHQVLLNLMINASDALEGRETKNIILTVFKDADTVVIRVEDTGCGMNEEQLKSLFRPFYTTKAKGTGLGLVIAKKLLAAINGEIKVASREHSGTTIDIVVPGSKQVD